MRNFRGNIMQEIRNKSKLMGKAVVDDAVFGDMIRKLGYDSFPAGDFRRNPSQSHHPHLAQAQTHRHDLPPRVGRVNRLGVQRNFRLRQGRHGGRLL